MPISLTCVGIAVQNILVQDIHVGSVVKLGSTLLKLL